MRRQYDGRWTVAIRTAESARIDLGIVLICGARDLPCQGWAFYPYNQLTYALELRYDY